MYVFAMQTIARTVPHIVPTALLPSNNIHYPGDVISVTYNAPVWMSD